MSPSLPSQIALPLSSGAPAEARRIVVGQANAPVIEALQDPARWPFHVAVLTGPPRSGKTLLARWAQGLVGPEQLDLIDNAETCDETDLFHRWNAVQQGGPGLVLQHCPLLQPGQILRNSSHTVFTFPLVIRFWTITGSQSRVWTMMWSLSWLFVFLVTFVLAISTLSVAGTIAATIADIFSYDTFQLIV